MRLISIFLVAILSFPGYQLISQSSTSQYTVVVPQVIKLYHQGLEHALLNGRIDTAWTIYNDMVSAVDTSTDIHARAWVWYHYGDVLSYSQRYKESNDAYYKAINTTNSTLAPDVVILIRGYNNLYYNADELGDYEEALDYILKSYEYLAHAPPGENQANIIFNLARCLKREGELGLAGRYMERVVELDKLKNDSLSLGYDYQFLAEIYRLKDDIPNTISEYNNAIAITPDHHSDRLAMYHNGLADAYEFREVLDSALHHADISIGIARASNLKNILANSLTEKGEICISKGDELCAKIALTEAQLLAEALGMKELNARIDVIQSEFLIGAAKRKKLLDVIKASKEEHWPALEMRAYNKLIADKSVLIGSQKLEILNNYNKMLKDRISADAGQEARRLEARMALIEREQQINDLQREADIAKREARANRIIRAVLIALIVLSLAGIILVYQIFKQKRKLTEADYRSQLAAKVSEVNALQSRLTAVMDQEKEVLSIPPITELNALIDNPLTEKEYEILVDVSRGLTNKEIGQQQYISANTVKFHLKNVFSKLDVDNRKEAVKLVMK